MSSILAVAVACAGHAGLAGEPEPARPSVSAPSGAVAGTARAEAIVDPWQPSAIAAGAYSPAWREMFVAQVAAMDASIVSNIERALAATGPNPGVSRDAAASYARFSQIMRNAEMQSYMLARSGKGHMKLASTTDDQVFLPIVPCRVVDTRYQGGPIAAGTTRNFLYYSTGYADDWSGQGGIAGPSGVRCPGTILPNGGFYGPSAAVVTVTVVNATAAGNYIIWGGADPIPVASALNWGGPGQTLANTTVIPWGGRGGGGGPGGPVQDFAVKYNGPSGSANFIADVVGYFVENRTTPLDCFEAAIGSAPISNGTQTVVGASCPSGWTLTGGNCDSSTFDAIISGELPSGNAWSCRYFLNAATATVYASSICCRVPGN